MVHLRCDSVINNLESKQNSSFCVPEISVVNVVKIELAKVVEFVDWKSIKKLK